jgi:perosamine synthetase
LFRNLEGGGERRREVSELALLGGKPVREKLFPAYKVVGTEEAREVAKIVESGILSRYIGAQHPDFMGGHQVKTFEAIWAETFHAKHAIAMNSATSGLYAAIGAAGVGPGDEVIVSPYTMMASVTAAVVFNAVPVFADIDPRTYCISADTIRPRITPRTKAIVVVHIFGQPADMDPIMELAREHNLIVIEDAAQAPYATYHDRSVGTLGHMGVFSLNYHKHIHTGEGGVVTTNDAALAEKLALIRNHAEAVVGKRGVTDIINMVGFNFRMGEIEATIGLCQLKKGPELVASRLENVAYLERKLAGVTGVQVPYAAQGGRHVYYLHALRYDQAATKVSRATFVAALKAELPATELREGEGPLLGAGYVRPIYLEPMYQQRTAYGDKGCPFACPHYKGKVSYDKGICPEVEKAHFETLMPHEMMRPPMTEKDLDDVAAAFHKVAENLDPLRAHEARQAKG